jgi:hypothetical protein
MPVSESNGDVTKAAANYSALPEAPMFALVASRFTIIPSFCIGWRPLTRFEAFLPQIGVCIVRRRLHDREVAPNGDSLSGVPRMTENINIFSNHIACVASTQSHPTD